MSTTYYKLELKPEWIVYVGTFYQESIYASHTSVYKLTDEIKNEILDLGFVDEYYYSTNTAGTDISDIIKYQKWSVKFLTKEDMLMAKFRL